MPKLKLPSLPFFILSIAMGTVPRRTNSAARLKAVDGDLKSTIS